ncbi:MAG TPA: 3-phosphoserine/phosphohydroxythreonine transaminase [Gammaproteobacteria bacterium]|nr:3-phosphoserine/phosphohydroxythreonine transaminase [Gammaproteobacteria bacterium]
MSRVYNFSAGPAVLPEAVLKQAQAEMLEWRDSGMSVMEMSHRDKYFMSIAEQAEADLREIMAIPSNYKVLFLQGGASMQFAMLPLNLLATNKKADYIQTGQWSEKAIAEARRYGTVNVIASTKDSKYTTVPAQASLPTSTDAAYLHYTPNETIVGVEFPYIPQTNVPLIADMSSTILSRPVDVSRFGVIYAGAQKNIGPAGLTLVIIREDLIGKAMDSTPVMLDYKTHATEGSMYNTPPTYGWYFAGLVFKWIKNLGGLKGMEAINRRKAEKLYAAIDGSSLYTNPVEKSCRSWMNVPFILANAELDKAFLAGAEKAGLTTLKGHRSVGGMRASIYNAMPEAGIDALIAYMKEFEKKNG